MPATTPKPEIKSNGVAAAAVAVEIDPEIADERSIEDIAPCSPRPSSSTSRRRGKRIPITTAIPMLPPIEQRHGPIVKPDSGKNGTLTQVYTNHFPTKVAPDLMLYQYDAVVEKPKFHSPDTWEEDMNRDHRRRLVQQLAENKAFDFPYW